MASSFVWKDCCAFVHKTSAFHETDVWAGRDPHSNQFFAREKDEYIPILSDTQETHIDFGQHHDWGMMVARNEVSSMHLTL